MSSLDVSARCPLSSSIVPAGSTGNVSTGDTPLSPIAVGGSLSTVSSRSSSPVTGGGPASAVSSRLLSLVTGGSPLSAVSGRLLYPVTGGGPLSAVLGRLSSPIAGGGSLSAVLGHLLSHIAGSGPSSAVLGRPLFLVPSVGSRVLFLTSTPSRAHRSSLPSSPLLHSFLPFSPTPLTCNPAPLSGKKLFDQAFIIQKPITSIRQQEELDLSFGQCSCSASVKKNSLWQFKLYDPKSVYLLKAILLLSLLI